ncbi:DUF3987 domain-containing protein [Shewanella sp. AS16]|uniref:DUF3987 domain-containing protein n=1 Tax=Shewanella sp. AS16 TaxID=2907625 RepID=UPI001F2F4BE6|nr:DUF3987 domain-containing protein [Shewanella sp. AS16]MCE9685829.1 DUF3987 domain-containing protein [Shewanella sp. AS16]
MMNINNNNDLEVVEACPVEKRTLAHETILCQMGRVNDCKLVTLKNCSKSGGKLTANDVKIMKISPKGPSKFYVQAKYPKSQFDNDLEVFASRTKDAAFWYSSKQAFAAVYCCECSDDARKHLKSIMTPPNCELRILSSVRLGRKNIKISNQPKVLTHYEIANRISSEDWLPHKPYSELGDYAMSLDELAVPPTLFRVAQSIWMRGNTNFDYVIASIIGLTGAILAQDFRVAVHKGATTYVSPNIWVMNVGHPSAGKTPVMLAALKNASSCVFQRDESRERKEEMAKQVIHQQLKNSLIKAVNNSDDEESPSLSIDEVELHCQAKLAKIMPKHINNRGVHISTDTTLAALYKLMQLGRPIAYVADEGGAFFKGLEKPDASSSALRGIFLNSESGNGHLNISRANQDDKVIEKAVVSVLAGIQPDVLGPYISAAQSGSGNDGLLNRFQWMVLPVTAYDAPSIKGGFSELKIITCKQFFDSLAKWRPNRRSSASGDHLQIHFSCRAREAYGNWLIHLQDERQKYDPKHLMHSQLGKYEALACKLGLIFQVFLNYDLDRGIFTPIKFISAEAFEYVEQTIDYLKSHAMTIFGADGVAKQEKSKLLFEKLKKKGVTSMLSLSEMAQCNWKGFSGRGDEAKDAILEALHYLEKIGLVKPKVKNGKTVWQINPKAVW